MIVIVGDSGHYYVPSYICDVCRARLSPFVYLKSIRLKFHSGFARERFSEFWVVYEVLSSCADENIFVPELTRSTFVLTFGSLVYLVFHQFTYD